MLQLIRHLFFDSASLLDITDQSADLSTMPSVVKGRGAKAQSLADKLSNLFGQLFVELGSQKHLENLMSEALMTMITLTSQNL